jgi:hypothetical protein
MRREIMRVLILVLTAVAATAGTAMAQTGVAPGNLPAYEVRLTFVGFSGSMADADCPMVRPSGRVTLEGILFGDETATVDDDLDYVGEMKLTADIDLCETTRTAAGEDKLCVIGVKGTSPVSVQLAVYFDDRGAYLKTERGTGPVMVTAAGSCGSEADAGERDAFPDNTMANPFDGTELEWPAGARSSRGAFLPLPLKDLPPGERVVSKGEHGTMTFQVLRAIPGGMRPPRTPVP